MTCRILIVDDDRDHADSIADILIMRGHEVELAYTGEDAVRRFGEGVFELTLMDVKLPGMNGVEAFLALRQQCDDAVVIMMTGFSLEHLLAQAVLSGAGGVLYKPFAAAELLEVIARTVPPKRAA